MSPCLVKKSGRGIFVFQSGGMGFISIVSPVVADLHVLGGVFQDLGKGFFGFFLYHVRDLLIGFLQDLGRCALQYLFVVLIQELLSPVHYGVRIPLVK